MFTVKCNRKVASSQEVVSYSYIDVLTKVVHIAAVAETQAS
jgi:uncharacterized protein Veg